MFNVRSSLDTMILFSSAFRSWLKLYSPLNPLPLRSVPPYPLQLITHLHSPFAHRLVSIRDAMVAGSETFQSHDFYPLWQILPSKWIYQTVGMGNPNKLRWMSCCFTWWSSGVQCLRTVDVAHHLNLAWWQDHKPHFNKGVIHDFKKICSLAIISRN